MLLVPMISFFNFIAFCYCLPVREVTGEAIQKIAAEAINSAAHASTIQEMVPPLPSIEGSLRNIQSRQVPPRLTADYPLPSLSLKPRFNRNVYPDYFREVGAGYIPSGKHQSKSSHKSHQNLNTPDLVTAKVARPQDSFSLPHNRKAVNSVAMESFLSDTKSSTSNVNLKSNQQEFSLNELKRKHSSSEDDIAFASILARMKNDPARSLKASDNPTEFQEMKSNKEPFGMEIDS